MLTIHFPPVEEPTEHRIPAAARGSDQEKPVPNKIRFTGVVLREFKRKLDSAGTAKFSAALTSATCDAMSWCDIPDCMTDVSLTGEIASITSFGLTPNEGKLHKHSLGLAVVLLDGFEAVRVSKSAVELRFQAHFTDSVGASKLEAYMVTVGDARGTLQVTYTEQDSLPIDDQPLASLEQQMAVSPEMD